MGQSETMKRYQGWIVLVDGRPVVMKNGAPSIRRRADSKGATVFAGYIDAVRAVNNSPWILPGHFQIVPLNGRRIEMKKGHAVYE